MIKEYMHGPWHQIRYAVMLITFKYNNASFKYFISSLFLITWIAFKFHDSM